MKSVTWGFKWLYLENNLAVNILPTIRFELVGIIDPSNKHLLLQAKVLPGPFDLGIRGHRSADATNTLKPSSENLECLHSKVAAHPLGRCLGASGLQLQLFNLKIRLHLGLQDLLHDGIRGKRDFPANQSMSKGINGLIHGVLLSHFV